jgi:hypothetical protein
MDFEEEENQDWASEVVGLGRGKEDTPAIGFLPVDLDNEFEIMLAPAHTSKPAPSTWQDQLSDLSSSSIASSKPPANAKEDDELMQVKPAHKPMLMSSALKAGTVSKPISCPKPATEFEAQILALLEDTDEQEDSDSDGESLYEPSSKGPKSGEKSAETPTFPSGKTMDFQGLEAGKENSARKKPEKSLESTRKTDDFASKPPSYPAAMLPSQQPAIPTTARFAMSKPSNPGNAVKPAIIGVSSSKGSREPSEVTSFQAEEVVSVGAAPPNVPKQRPSPFPPSKQPTEASVYVPSVSSTNPPPTEPIHPTIPAKTSALMGLMMREVVIAAPPSAPALNSSFRRHRFLREDRSSIPEGLLEKMADDALATFPPPVEAEIGTGTRPKHRKTESNPPPELKEEREEVKEKPTIPRLALDQLKSAAPKIRQVLGPSEEEKQTVALPSTESATKPSSLQPKPIQDHQSELIPATLSSQSIPSTSSLSTSSEPPSQPVKPAPLVKPSNPVQFQLHNKLSSKAQGKPTQPEPSPDRPRRLSNEFEEDAMGEAKEWLAFSANPDLNDSEESEGDDEFSISAKGSVRLKVTAEKQFTSNVKEDSTRPTLESVQLEKEKEAKGKEKKGKRVDLKTRKMIAEAKLGENTATSAVPKQAAPPVKPIVEKVPKPAVPRPVLEAIAKPEVSKKEDSKSQVLGVGKQVKKEEKKVNWLEQDDGIELVIEDDMGPPIAPVSTATSNTFFSKPPPAPSQPPVQEDEWDKATALAIEERSKPKEQLLTSLITHNEVWPVFEHMDIRTYREPQQKVEPPRVSWMSKCFRAAPVELEDNLKDQRDRIYALLHVTFNDSPLHLQVLMSLWKFLTRTKEDCPRYGHHWDRLGFQGADPATDLRSMGIFGLLQLLFFACYLPEETDTILTYSRQSGCNFPFAAVSLNITKMTIEALREGKLNKLIVKCGEAYRTVLFTQVDFFYASVFVRWFELYRKRELTVADIGFLNKDILTEVKSNPDRLFRSIQRIYKQA